MGNSNCSRLIEKNRQLTEKISYCKTNISAFEEILRQRSKLTNLEPFQGGKSRRHKRYKKQTKRQM